MSLSCESVARRVLPVYRSFVAKELILRYKLTQNVVARKLGTTQAAISQYVNSKRGVKGIPNYAEIEALIQEAAAKVAQRMVTSNFTSEEFSDSFCDLCMELRKNKKI
ncbi:MAG: helix-turn-helix domain-containing protein [Candidatus Bathyarchaeota archaeon]|nr:helix-turn-helix domain-containing protein [Candidatus Bathyarchaeota archaeon]